MKKNFRVAMAVLMVACCCSACSKKDSPSDDNGQQGSGYVYNAASYLRIAALGNSSSGGSWLLDTKNGLSKDYNADDILEFIDELKPDWLEGFIAGQPNPGETLPVREGSPSMTVQQFLDAAIKSGGEQCRIIPTVSLLWLSGKESQFWGALGAYYGMTLSRPIRSIHLSDWAAYCKTIHKTAQERSDMLNKVRGIGYEEILVDFTGNNDANDPGIDGAYLDIDPLTWQANDNQLKTVKSCPNIAKVLLQIASPATLGKFRLNSADKQADILCNTLYPNQKTQGYNFVFPLMDGDWNARVSYTTKTGKYKSNSIYEVSRDLVTEGAFCGLDPGPRDDVAPPPPGPVTPGLPERYVRMVVWADEYQSDHWKLTQAKNPGTYAKDYTAQDVLEMIAELKPDCLERFITGTGEITTKDVVPVRAGYPSMPLVEFLQKAMDAGNPGCYIMPKLNLQWLVSNKTDPMGNNLFWRSAQAIYDLALNPPIRTLSLDCWDAYVSTFTSVSDRDVMFKRLRDMGYQKIYVNYTGNANANHTQVDGADFNINTTTWTINETTLNKLKGYANLEKIFLYIDYPGAMDQFALNTPDRQAEIYCKNIYPYQKTLNLTFVFAIFQAGWDANAVKTSSTGPYKGKTMFEISKDLLLYGAVQ